MTPRPHQKLILVVAFALSGGPLFAAEDEPAGTVGQRWSALRDSFAPPPGIPESERYAPPLQFKNGRPVKTAADWAERRKELLADWHGMMGPWPPLLDEPTATILGAEDRDGITQHHVRIPVAPTARVTTPTC